MNGKRFALLSIAIFFILSGCSAFHVKRTYSNRIFWSPSPRLKIETKEEMAMMLDYNDQKLLNKGMSMSRSTYAIGQADKKGRIEKALVVKMIRLNQGLWGYRSDDSIFEWVDNKFDQGLVTLANKKYQYVVTTLPSVFYKKELKQLAENGYRLNSCYLVYGLGRVTNFDRPDEDLIQIYFIDSISHYDGMALDCRHLNQSFILTKEQRAQISLFAENSKKEIQVLK